MRVNFATGVIVGILLASLAVIASSGYSGPSALGPFAPAMQTAVQSISAATTTTTASSSTTTSTAVINAIPARNLTGSVAPTVTTFTSTTSQSGAGFSSLASALPSSPGRPPSSLAVIANNPFGSLLLLLPVAFAIVLGLAFYRVSRTAD